MLDLLAERVPDALSLQGDAAHLPIRTGSIAGAVASAVYVHVDRPELPAVLDLRGYPPTNVVGIGGEAVPGRMLPRTLLDALSALLRDIQPGLVVLVDQNSWAVERCL